MQVECGCFHAQMTERFPDGDGLHSKPTHSGVYSVGFSIFQPFSLSGRVIIP